MIKHGIIIKTRSAANEDIWLIAKDGTFISDLVRWQQTLYGCDYSPNTVRSYVYDLSKLWDFQHEYEDRYELTQQSSVAPLLLHFKKALLNGDERLGWQPLKKTSVKHILNSLNSYSDFSMPLGANPLIKTSGWVNSRPGKDSFFAHLRTPILTQSTRRLVRVKTGPTNWNMKYFPFAHINKFIFEAPSARDRCLYTLMAMGGLRLSEALNLWIDDVSFKNDRICVRVIDPEERKTDLWKKYRLLPDPLIRNKGRTNTEVFFLDGGISFFKAFETYIFNERPPIEEHPYLFINLKAGPSYGKRLQPNVVRERFSSRCTKLGIDHYAPHSLRHFYGVFAMNVLREHNPKIDIEIIQQMMGHASIDSTKIYAIFFPETIHKELAEAFIKIRENGIIYFDEVERYK